LWRCSGPLTATTLHRPFTVFTIAEFGTGKGQYLQLERSSTRLARPSFSREMRRPFPAR
ncbi:hypothetical protein BGZ65_011905, partial [Modicella reniformis]